MIKSERRDYQFAIFGSLVFHLLLFVIYFPNGLLRQEMNLKTYPVGMVSLPKGSGGLDADTPVMETTVNEPNSPPGAKPENQPIRTEPVKKEPEPPKTNLPEHTIATSDAPDSKVKPLTPVPLVGGSGPTRPAGEGAGSGRDGSGGASGPRGLGNGEGKLFRMGALPPYPKNAMNEGVQGTVGLRILVLSNGGLEKIELVNSSGDSRLDKAALRAVNNWQFQPESEAYSIDIIFAFDLKNGVSIRFLKAETRP